MLNLIIKHTHMKKYKYIAMALGTLLFASCDDMLTTHYEGGTQDDDYIQTTVEANPERVNSAVSGMYQVIKQPLGYFWFFKPCRRLRICSMCIGSRSQFSRYDQYR